MRFRTEMPSVKTDLILDPRVPVVLAGSCFAENMAVRMRRCLWKGCNLTCSLFNPVSIAFALKLLLDRPSLRERARRTFFRKDDLWFSWAFDTGVNAASEEELFERVDEMSTQLSAIMLEARALFVTLGTSWCYELRDDAPADVCLQNVFSGETVANCHKMPSSMFRRYKLSPAETVEVLQDLMDFLHERYPELRIVFTVSPVRHIKDGFVENTRSKAALLLAVEELCAENTGCLYFPAYELLNDDLRDYRFYASDLVHPSEVALEYIWSYFVDSFLDADGRRLVSEGESVWRMLNHRALIECESSRRHAVTAQRRYSDFLRRNPGMGL